MLQSAVCYYIFCQQWWLGLTAFLLGREICVWLDDFIPDDKHICIQLLFVLSSSRTGQVDENDFVIHCYIGWMCRLLCAISPRVDNLHVSRPQNALWATLLGKMADSEDQEPTPAQDIVVTKYKMAGDMVNGTYFVHKVWLCVFWGETWNEDHLLNKFNCVVNLPCARGKPAWRIATMWSSIECLCRRRSRGSFDLLKHKRGLGFENVWTLFGILVYLFFVYQTFLFMTHFRPRANSCQLSYHKTYIRLNSGSELWGKGSLTFTWKLCLEQSEGEGLDCGTVL